MPRAVGIDIGTAKVALAVAEGGKPRLIPNAEGDETTPAVVAVTSAGHYLVGTKARRHGAINPEETVGALKRLLGRFYDEVTTTAERAPYRVERGPHDTVRIGVRDRLFAPEELMAVLLHQLGDDAVPVLGERIQHAVIAVPAAFTHAQRQAVWDAATIAGFHVLELINEPTAAALAYALETGQSATVMVVDCGGGGCEISLLEVGGGGCEMRASAGDLSLGGDDIDRWLVDSVVETWQREQGVDLGADRQTLYRLYEAVERAKCEVSSVLQTTLQLPHLVTAACQPCHLAVPLTRAQVAMLADPLTQRCAALIAQTLSDARMHPRDIDTVLFVGRVTRMPFVQDMVKKCIGRSALVVWLHPNEGVARGAALRAGMLMGTVENVGIFDATPLALSVETPRGQGRRLIERHTTLPCRKSELFATAVDNQPAIELGVLQGEHETMGAMRRVKRVSIAGIRPAPRGVPRIEVTVDLDASGLLAVQARDYDTGTSLSVTIDDAPNLPRKEVERLRNKVTLRGAQPGTERKEPAHGSEISELL